ncbi:MAG: hypothetical protein MUE38_06600 [Flavihumibacter sp.]|nr:hypothetical protein [Flavihumibacter sp.]
MRREKGETKETGDKGGMEDGQRTMEERRKGRWRKGEKKEGGMEEGGGEERADSADCKVFLSGCGTIH